MAVNFVEMESMIPRVDFAKRERCAGYLDHEVFISVKQKNLDLLEEEVLRRSTPGSPLYQQWMTRAEVDAMKSNPEGGAAVAQFLTDHNVEITWSSRNQDYMKATTTIAHWENLLNTEFYMWEDLKGGESTNGEIGSPYLVPRAMRYSIPFEIAEHVHAFTGVTNLPARLSKGSVRSKYPVKHSSMLRGEATADMPRRLSSGEATISFLDTYYDIASNIGSAEITQSVFETNGQSFSPGDLQDFQEYYGTTVQPANVIGGHSVSSCSMINDQCTEGNLDIQYIMGMSQVTSSTYYYVGGNDPFVSYVTAIQDSSDPILVNSISWGSVEQDNPASSLSTFYTETMALAGQGVTVLVSSGDQGVSNSDCACNVSSSSSDVYWASNSWNGEGYFPSFPASCPYVTAVGATMGPTDGNPEVACQADEGGVITSGGGFSSYYSMPSWQTEAVNTYFSRLSTPPAPGYNPQGRAYPDVSLIGVDYPVIINGLTYLLFGTSASAPVFAAYVSLLNAARLNQSLNAIGFLNPTLYSAGNNVTMPNATTPTFNDITVGDNFCCSGSDPSAVECCSSGFYTATGWDPVTGWGSIDFPSFALVYGSVVTSISSSGDGGSSSNSGTTAIIVVVVLVVIVIIAGVMYGNRRKRSSPDYYNSNADVSNTSVSSQSAHSVHSTNPIIAQPVGYNAQGQAIYAIQPQGTTPTYVRSSQAPGVTGAAAMNNQL